jgi:hypothetical protein
MYSIPSRMTNLQTGPLSGKYIYSPISRFIYVQKPAFVPPPAPSATRSSVAAKTRKFPSSLRSQSASLRASTLPGPQRGITPVQQRTVHPAGPGRFPRR